jgi:hydrogenase expression/formation protein HypD
VVFLGVGFETTAPTVAGTVLMAREQGIANFKVLAFHKLVPPALAALLSDETARIDAFILPVHVSAIIGTEPYGFIASRFATSATVTGFEPVDILESLLFLATCQREGRAEVRNLYRRVVADDGNARAREIMDRVFRPADALWRGLGRIPDRGLRFAWNLRTSTPGGFFGLSVEECPPLPGCRCGDVLKGRIRPDQCPLFKTACTPAKPVGTCMVSTEGVLRGLLQLPGGIGGPARWRSVPIWRSLCFFRAKTPPTR